MITPPSFPARPLNGGPLDKAGPKPGKWAFTPKINGWRTLVHVPTRTMFNRHNEPLTIAGEFKEALASLYCTLDAEAFKWVDCEALDRRHGIGRGCLVVLDVIPEPEYASTSWEIRRNWIDFHDRRSGYVLIKELDLSPPTEFPKLSLIPVVDGSMEIWEDLQTINKSHGCDYYEGLVAWREDAPYPIQLRSSSEESTALIKHRWKH